MDTRVETKIDGGIAYVWLNRPEKHNALDFAMFKALDACIRALAKDKGVRAVILQGRGEDFCTGLDVKSVLSRPRQAFSLLAKWWPGRANLAQRVSVGWRDLPVPVIAVIQGRCWGGGLQIALGADVRIATPDADLSVMEGKWGLIPDMGGTLALREIMPKDKAMVLAMSAKTLDAKEAEQMGLVTQVSEQALQEAEQLAQSFANRSPDAIGAVKRLYRKAWQGSRAKALALESWYQIKVLLGKNQRIATKRELKDPEASYKPRGSW